MFNSTSYVSRWYSPSHWFEKSGWPHTPRLSKAFDMVKRHYGRTSSVSQMLESLKWRRLDQRRIDQRLIMFRNIIHDQVAIQMPSYVQPNNRPSRTTNSQAYRQVQSKSDLHKYSFFPRTVTHWNSLPETVVNMSGPMFSRAVSQIEHVSP